MTYPTDAEVAAQLSRARGYVLDQIAATAPVRRRSRRRRGLLVTFAAVGVAAALTAGAIAVHRATNEDVRYAIDCYESADLGSRRVTVDVPERTDSVTGEITRDPIDPLTSCGSVWQAGLLGQASQPADPNTADFPIPDLVTCAQRNGVGAAFPRGDSTLTDEQFCRNLGLGGWAG